MSGNKPCNAATYRTATAKLAADNSARIIVEVGVYAGALSRMFAELPSLEKLYVVDSWAADYSRFGKEHMDAVAQEVIGWGATQPKVDVRRLDSSVAAQEFENESIDFFHTDGDHSAEGIRADINSWLPKVRIGGIMSGDNYELELVAGGVDELLPHRELLAKGRLWWARKLS